MFVMLKNPICVTTDLTLLCLAFHTFFFFCSFLQLSLGHYYLHHRNIVHTIGSECCKMASSSRGVIWTCRAIIRPHGSLKGCSHITDSPSCRTNCILDTSGFHIWQLHKHLLKRLREVLHKVIIFLLLQFVLFNNHLINVFLSPCALWHIEQAWHMFHFWSVPFAKSNNL